MPEKSEDDIFQTKPTILKDETVIGREITVDDDINSVRVLTSRAGLDKAPSRNVAYIEAQQYLPAPKDYWQGLSGNWIIGGELIHSQGYKILTSWFKAELYPGKSRKVRVVINAIEEIDIKVDIDTKLTKVNDQRDR